MREILPLAVLSFLFLGIFLHQQGRSRAEAVLEAREAIQEAAARTGVEPDLALALVWEEGCAGEQAEVEVLLRRYRALLDELGREDLALAVLAGHRALVEDLLDRSSGADGGALAAKLLLETPEGMDVVRVRSMAGRLPLVRRRD